MNKLIWIVAAQLLAGAASQGQAVDFVPLFQFQVFYYQDQLEIDPGANMIINGPVQANHNIYTDPGTGATLTFQAAVTAGGGIFAAEDPLDPTSRGIPGSISFEVPAYSGTLPYYLWGDTFFPSGYALLQVPPLGESPTSAPGTNRLYNQADMIVLISDNNTIFVSSGVAVDNQATVIPSDQWSLFISTNGIFYDPREGLRVYPVCLDIKRLRQWSATNTELRPVLASAPGRSSATADVQSVFVADLRMLSSASAVIMTNYGDTTNTALTITSDYPPAGTYFPPIVTNTIVTTSLSYPEAATFIPPVTTTNTTSSTSANYPTNGTYIPPVTTNTTVTTSASLPAPGTYLGTIITNQNPTSYTYNLITGYTYDLITSYIYNAISGYIYSGITGVTTNIAYVTNYPFFAEPGILLTNGATLPSNGLSVITPDPAYIVGNWNVSTDGVTLYTGTSNTSHTLPSAIFADAINILSPAWSPNNSSNSISSRLATADTVNAGFFTGDVPSDGLYYSGGLENFLRLAENWSAVPLTWNGSMCCMFASQIATGPWPGTGTVYNPPTRNWAFDTNFNGSAKLPPLTPGISQVVIPVPAMQAVAQADGSVLLFWSTRTGATYTVQFTSELSQGNWQNLASLIASNTIALLSDLATNTQRFYRLQIIP